MHGHPGLAGFQRYADKNPGVVIVVTHFVHHANQAVAQLAAGPVQEPHAPVCPDEAILNGHFPRAYMFPTRQVLSVEKLLPFFRLALGGRLSLQGTRQKNRQNKQH